MRVTWWGHSTITVEAAGSRLLTDPVLTNRVGHLRRRRGPRPPAEAGRADAVLVSHLHADHLHLTSLPLVDPAARIVVPKGAAALVARECGPAIGDRCVEVEPGTRVRVGEVTVTAVPARHDDRRGPWSSEVARPVGYRIDGPALSAWFAGDTDLYDEMAREIGQVDLALVPVHFGTFWPIGLDWVRPERFLPPGEVFRDLLADDQVRVDVLAPGESAEVVPDER